MRSPELALELRAARPVASAELRHRVLAVSSRGEPVRPPRFALPRRRFALVAVPAVFALAVGGAVVHGLVSSGSSGRNASVSHLHPSVARSARGAAHGELASPAPAQLPEDLPSALPSVTRRLQQYAASLRVQVETRRQLSDATKRAMRVTRLLGGYVASAQYDAPRQGEGSAWIVVRIPVDRVQDAVEEYSALGTLLAQKVAIADVTKAVEEQAKEIARLRADVARLERGGVTRGERGRYAAEKARLDYLTKRKSATVRRAQFARVSLALTTKPKPRESAAPASRFHRTMSDAGGVLLREGEILLYALIVGGPLLLLGAAAIGAVRLGQGRRDAQLLERS
jgi:Domain of unknown function (DUF4349)